MKCPCCKADIEENARFCFYCMTSLEEKETVATPVFHRKYRAVIIAALFAVVLLVCGILWWNLGHRPAPEKNDDQLAAGESLTVGTQENASQTTDQSSGGATTGPVTVPDQGSAAGGDPDQAVSSQPNSNVGSSIAPPGIGQGSSSSSTGNTGSSSSTPSYEGSGNVSSGTTSSGSTGSSDTGSVGGTVNSGSMGSTNQGSTEPSLPTVQPEQTEPATPSVTLPETPSEEINQESNPDNGTTASPPASAAVVYSYRAAQYAVDDYHVTANVDDCVVITGIVTPATDGVYRIPSTLDGKKVIAVVKQAFNAEEVRDTVRQVYLPASVRTVHDYAFSACRNLTDIYFEGSSVYVSSLAFAAKEKRTGTLTIHSSYDCNNRDFRYYRNIAESYYDAEWSEI